MPQSKIKNPLGSGNSKKNGPRSLTPGKNQKPADIAIVGMGCMLPKAPELKKYWENILNKVDTVTEVPKNRWDWKLYFDPDPKTRDRCHTKWGAFQDAIPFDPVRYGMPPNTLPSIEPLQLLTLEAVYSALEDADYLERPFPRDRTAVILGFGGGAGELAWRYGFRSALPLFFDENANTIADYFEQELPEWTEDSFAGIIGNVAAGRIANRFDLGGPNYTVDAACASALAATQAAIRELETHNSDMVITGGVDALNHPFAFLCFAKTMAVSPRGRCQTFDDSADGMVLGEGQAVFVFKRLADAERDKDRIYAVIKGVGSSSDGRAKGLTAPRLEGQVLSLNRAYKRACFSPSTVTLMEAHGTGTVVGDETELLALSHVFKESKTKLQSCAVGSVKSMIGHLKGAAGAASIAKVAMALYHKVLPPTLGVEKPNHLVDFNHSPFYINTESRPWINGSDGIPRRAGVSAFGFGGTNFHVVLEEYKTENGRAHEETSFQEWPCELFIWASPTREGLLEALEQIAKALSNGARPQLRDLAYSLFQQARTVKSRGKVLRIAVIASSLDDLLEKLTKAKEAMGKESGAVSDPRGIYYTDKPMAGEGKIAFLFPGQGSQHTNMLREMILYFPEMTKYFGMANQALKDRLPKPLSAYIFPPPEFDDEQAKANQADLTQTNIAQPAMGTADMALYHLLDTFGVKPDLTAGHSYGEYMALYAAGVFSPDDLIRVSEARGRFIVEAARSEPGTMAAVVGDREVVGKGIEGIEGVWIANLNAPKQTVITGTDAGVKEAMERFKAQEIRSKQINVACAFHSPLVSGARDRLGQYLSEMKISRPRIDVYSNTTGEVYPKKKKEIAALLAEQLIRPVEFVKEIEALYEAGARIFLEIGPRAVLTRLVENTLGDRPFIALSPDPPGSTGLTKFLLFLGRMVIEGVPLTLDRLFQGREVRELDLAELEKETGEIELPPHVWLVNGSRALPQSEAKKPRPSTREPLEITRPRPLDEQPSPESSKKPEPPEIRPSAPTAAIDPTPPLAQENTIRSPERAPVPPPTATAPPAESTIKPEPKISAPPLITTPSPNAGSEIPMPAMPVQGSDQIIIQFQRMMGKFLETQKTIMQSYLHGAAQASDISYEVRAPAETIPAEQTVEIPQARPVPAVEPVPAAVAAEIPAPHEPAGEVISAPEAAPQETPAAGEGTDREAITAHLLSIVSERTGYPPEMLDLDLDLEADLGIDSIKRVEIIGAVQEQYPALTAGDEGALQDEMGAIKTLRNIIDWMVEHLGASEQAQPKTEEVPVPADVQAPSEAATADTGAGSEEVTAHLLSIVSERTGYPPEMLDLDLDLEADLGIDSIKRVEIMGAVLEKYPALAAGDESAVQDELSQIKTLRGIIDWIVEHSGAEPREAAPAEAEVRPSPTPAGDADREAVTSQLLHIVSERTGYPPEMLDLDLDLEADLGIDSIKRVEIMGAVLEQHPSLAGDDGAVQEELSQIKTLRGIIDWIVNALGSQTGAEAAGPSPAEQAAAPEAPPAQEASKEAVYDEPDDAVFIPRFTVHAVEEPLDDNSLQIKPGSLFLVTDDEGGLSEALAGEIRRLGGQVAMVKHGDASAELGEGLYQANLGDPDAAVEIVDRVRRKLGPVTGLVHLLPLKAGASFADMNLDDWKARLRQDIKSLFYLAKATGDDLEQAAASGGGWIVAASAACVNYPGDTAGEDTCFPGHGGLAGLIKTINEEWPAVQCKAVDFDRKAPAATSATHILREMADAGGEIEVAYRENKRFRLSTDAAELDRNGPVTLDIGSDWVLLITGGATGITSAVTIELARHYRPTLVLAGIESWPEGDESPATAGVTDERQLKAALIEQMKQEGKNFSLPEVEKAYRTLLRDREMRRNVATLKQAGSTVHYHQVNVMDQAAFEGLIDKVYEEFGHIDGMIHGAGIIDDKLVKDKTPASFDRVFDLKADSSFMLSRKLRGEDLKFLVFFSSMAGRFGNRGQCDYAATNEVMCKLAVHLDKTWPGRIIAVNWGPWATAGVASAEVQKQLAERGVQIIPLDGGPRVLNRDLRFGGKGDAEVVAGDGPWASIIRIEKPVAPATPITYPMLENAHIEQEDGMIQVVRPLDPAYDLYLEDHQLDDKFVFPAAMAMEIMGETISRGWPELELVGFREFRALQGIVIKKSERARAIRVAAQLRTNSSERPHVDMIISNRDKPKQVHYRAIAELSKTFDPPESIEPFTLRKRLATPITAEHAYREILFHGPIWQGISEIKEIGSNGIRATLRHSSPRHFFRETLDGPWLFDPLLLDCYFHLVIIWTKLYRDMRSLPSNFQTFRRWGSIEEGPIDCQVRILPHSGKNNIYSDVVFIGPDGSVLGLLEEGEHTCSRSLDRAVARSGQRPEARM